MKSLRLKFMAAAVAAVLGSSGANALTLYAGGTLLEDDNLDYLSYDANSNGMLDVGDQLTAILDFTRIASIPPGSSYDPLELTGFTTIEVASKTLLYTLPNGNPVYAIAYTTAKSFTDVYGSNSMVALFTDSDALNLTTNCTSVVGCQAEATDGSLWATLGLASADDQWFSVGSDDLASASTGNAATKYATVNFALSFLTNNTGYVFGLQSLDCNLFTCAPNDGKAEVIGSADILGGAGLAEGNVRSDTDATVNPIPEPGTLALFGIGLLGFGAARRRIAK